MITKYFPNKLSSYCKSVYGFTLGGMFKNFGVVHVHYSRVRGIDLYLVTPFTSRFQFDEALRASVFTYCYSSDSLSSIIEFFKKKYPKTNFRFVVYEK